jgi:hypothetical protein
MTHQKRWLLQTVAVTGLAFSGSLPASAVDPVLKLGEAANQAGQVSQRKIDALAKDADDLFQDYKTVNKEIDGLRVYNTRLERQIDNQLQRIKDIEESIQQVTVIQRQVLPMIIRMIDGLEQFVALDIPFHLEERQQRIAFLRANVDRSDLSVAEKFRQVLEAYKIENEYGRKIDAYKGTVNIDGVDREVNFFRVGRIALMYQTTDLELSGAWDKQAGQFVALVSGDYRNAIQKGLRIARKQASIDVLKVPVMAPEVAQ